jgi:rSAM/selenodomain-associated transferase 1
MSKSIALVLFVKNARRGHVKTRLASFLGDEMALKIYLALCERVRDVCLHFPGTCYVYYSEFVPEEEDMWSDSFFIKKTQSTSPDLGERMKSAITELCPSYESVLLLGTDIPHLTIDILKDASQALNENELVIGPSLDGGYYLIGMKETHEFLFDDMIWSVDTVLDESIQRAIKNKLYYHLLKPLPDIDTFEDWKKYGWF